MFCFLEIQCIHSWACADEQNSCEKYDSCWVISLLFKENTVNIYDKMDKHLAFATQTYSST